MYGKDYVRIWTAALYAFGWPERRIHHFVSQWSDDLENEESLFYHEAPAYYLTWELLSEKAVNEISTRLGNRSKGYPWELFVPVQRILNHHLGYYQSIPENPPHKEPDWSVVKREISTFLAMHGESMRYETPV